MNTVYNLVETIVFETKQWLPLEHPAEPLHSSNVRLSAETRTRLAFLEDSLKKAKELDESRSGH